MSLQQILPYEWTQHSVGELAATIITWLATSVTPEKAEELLHIIESKNWMRMRLFAGNLPKDLPKAGSAAPSRI